MLPDMSTPYRTWLRRSELTLSLLLLLAIGLLGASIAATVDEFALTIGFFVPVLLGVIALVGAGLDIYRITWDRSGPIVQAARWVQVVQATLVIIIGLLALATLGIVVQTILIVTVIDTGGGVILGPLLWLFTGTALAAVIVVRSITETYLVADRSTPLIRSVQ